MANVSFVLDAEEAKAVNAFLKVVDAQKKAETGFQRLNAKVDEHGKKTESTVNISARSMLEMASGIGAVTLAWNAATSALGKYHEIHERAADLSKQVINFRGEMAQLPNYAENIKQAHQLAMQSGMGLDEAYKTQYQVASGTLSEADKQAIVDTAGWVNNQEELVTNYISARSAMSAEEVGDFRQMVAKAIAANKNSNATVPGIVKGLAGVGGAVAAVGGTDEEAIGYLAKFTDVYGEDMAKTFVNSMATTIQEKGLQKMGFHKALLKINEKYRKLSGEDRIKYMPREESRKGFDVMTQENIRAIEKTTSDANLANFTGMVDLVGDRKTEFFSDPVSSAVMRQRRAERLREVEEMERLAPHELGLQTAIDKGIGNAHQKNASIDSVIAREMGMSVAKKIPFYSNGTILAAGDLAAELTTWEGAKNVGGDLVGWAGEGVTTTLKNIEKLLAGILAKDNPAPKPTPNMQAE